jgi:acetoacetate decarboxylase
MRAKRRSQGEFCSPALLLGNRRHNDQDHPTCRLHAPDLRAHTLFSLWGHLVKGAWSGPAAIELFEHAMCDVARLPVCGVVSASHFVTGLTLGLGEVVHDYLKES